MRQMKRRPWEEGGRKRTGKGKEKGSEKFPTRKQTAGSHLNPSLFSTEKDHGKVPESREGGGGEGEEGRREGGKKIKGKV